MTSSYGLNIIVTATTVKRLLMDLLFRNSLKQKL